MPSSRATPSIQARDVKSEGAGKKARKEIFAVNDKMTFFLERIEKARKEKKSRLCVTPRGTPPYCAEFASACATNPVFLRTVLPYPR